jgi:RNA polymerase-binding transcription factor DksA
VTDEELKALFEGMRHESAAERDDMRRHFDETANRLTQENRQYFDVTTEKVRDDIRLSAEALTHVEERLDRRITKLEDRVERGFASLKACVEHLESTH